MRFIKKNRFALFLFGILLLLYRNWFLKGVLSAPDFPFVYPMQLSDYGWLPYAWSSFFGNGLGGPMFDVLNLETYLHLGIRLFVFVLHIPWSVTYRIIFFWPFVVLGTLSSYLFSWHFAKNKSLAAVGAFIYMTNTYVLMLAGGGQVGLMMAYAVAPLTLWAFINKRPVLFAMATFFLLLFDLRFSFLIAVCLVLYILAVIPIREWLATIRRYIVPCIVIVGMHSFWLLPTVLSHSLALPAGYDNPGWLSYLSWAEFSKTFSLLHPNWPENIFGKTYFMKPEFLIIPMLAFGSLLFIGQRKQKGENKDQKKHVLFFAFLGLLGVFFAKGVNPPFGNINAWFFARVPLFNVFRDPTKYYLLTVISYSVLIPYVLQQIASYLRTTKMRFYASVSLTVFVGYWLFTLWPFINGTVTGTFGNVSIPSTYDRFAMMVYGQTDFGRTLIVPWRNRFVYQSENHPAVNARDVFNTTDIQALGELFKAPNTFNVLRHLAVKYVVVPDDVTNEIFMTDRKYNPALKEQLVRTLDAVPYLTKKKGFDNLVVYEITNSTGHFYTILPNQDITVYTAHKINPVTYTVDVTVPYRPAELIFSENFDPGWQLWDGKKYIYAQKTFDGVISFTLDSNITGSVTVYYQPQHSLNIGYQVSLAVLLVVAFIWYLRMSRRLRFSKKIHVFVALVIFGLWVAFLPRERTKNVVTSPAIWRSKEWQRLHNPILGKDSFVSRYGGSEIRFAVANSRSFTLKASSSNTEPNSQGVDISVQGKTYTIVTPIDEKELHVVFDDYNKTKYHDVIIRHWCAGTMEPCDLALNEIRMENGSVIAAPQATPLKTVAVLGDSIAVSFGNSNAMYLLADRLGYQLHNASVFGSSVSVIPDWDSGLLRYQEDIVRYKPDVIVLFLGTNDLGHGIPIPEFYANYEKLLAGITQGSPTSKIVALGLLRRKDYPQFQIKAYSAVIKQLAIKHQVSYIDPFDWLDDADFQDVVHPAPKSEQKLASKLYDALIKVLRE